MGLFEVNCPHHRKVGECSLCLQESIIEGNKEISNRLEELYDSHADQLDDQVERLQRHHLENALEEIEFACLERQYERAVNRALAMRNVDLRWLREARRIIGTHDPSSAFLLDPRIDSLEQAATETSRQAERQAAQTAIQERKWAARAARDKKIRGVWNSSFILGSLLAIVGLVRGCNEFANSPDNSLNVLLVPFKAAFRYGLIGGAVGAALAALFYMTGRSR